MANFDITSFWYSCFSAEVVEQAKDGYESDVPELKNEKRSYNRGYSENSNKER